MNPIVVRALIGGVAGATATLALASVLRRFGRGVPGASELALSDMARGAAVGALIAAMDARPARLAGALAGGGLWLASEIAGPEIAIRPARGEARGAVMLAAHLAWGWTAAGTIRELGARLA
ncbi:MAG: hypothetical protein AB7O91_06750 [Sphingomonas sp.]